MFLVVCLVLWDVYCNERFLVYERPYGVVRLRLKQPDFDSNSNSNVTYCNRIPCVRLNRVEMAAQDIGEHEIFITTRIREEVDLSLDPDLPKHQQVEYPLSEKYAQSVEEYLVRLSGNVEFSKKKKYQYSWNLSNLTGSLLTTHNTRLIDFPTDGEPHDVPVGMWLKAAGVSLDDTSDSLSKKPDRDTYRDEGLILRVELDFDNTQNTSLFHWLWYPTPLPHFSYKVRKIPNTEFKILMPGNNRTHIIRRQGIYMSFHFSGFLARFSWSVLITHLSANLAGLRLVMGVMIWVGQWWKGRETRKSEGGVRKREVKQKDEGNGSGEGSEGTKVKKD